MRISALLTSVLGIAAMAAPAFAAPDHKTYPGYACQANNASIFYSSGRALNSLATGNDILCPVARDLTVPTQGIQSARVWVIDQDPAIGNVTCMLASRSSPTVGLHSFEIRRTPPGSSPIPQALSFGTLVPGGTPVLGDADDYYEVDCSVPGTAAPAVGFSGIVSYEINEN